eukprot:6458101-Amphidinium_carterae.1
MSGTKPSRTMHLTAIFPLAVNASTLSTIRGATSWNCRGDAVNGETTSIQSLQCAAFSFTMPFAWEVITSQMTVETAFTHFVLHSYDIGPTRNGS